MKAYKGKTQETEIGRMGFLQPKVSSAIKIEAVHYTSKDPGSRIHLFDADGDEVLHPIPGQLENKVIPLETPITVQGPIQFRDETDYNSLVVFGSID